MRNLPKIFASRYDDGRCSLCPKRIRLGMPICSDTKNGWCHAACYSKAHPPVIELDDFDLGEPDVYIPLYEELEHLPRGTTWEAIRTLYRRCAMACHPDRCPVHHLPVKVAEAAFKRLNATYVRLEKSCASR